MKYISSFYFGFEAFSVNQWKEVDEIECDAPNPEEDCAFLDGRDVLDFYAHDEDRLPFDLGMLLALAVGFRFIGYLCVYFRARRSY